MMDMETPYDYRPDRENDGHEHVYDYEKPYGISMIIRCTICGIQLPDSLQ